LEVLVHRFYTALAVAAGLVALALFIPDRTLGADRQVAYTGGQLAMGQAQYTQYCSGCHLPTLAGNPASTPPRPPLTGPKFASKWQGKTAADLFNFASKNMPYGHGGTLGHDQYMAIVAYVLQQNGVASDGKLLDDKRLSTIQLP
jgi:polar amino acid transport system substrate-binding protein